MRIKTKDVGAVSLLTLSLVFGCAGSSEPESVGERTEALQRASHAPHEGWGRGHEDGPPHNGDSHHGDRGACTVDQTATQRVITFQTKEDCDDGALEWKDKLETSLVDGTVSHAITITWHKREIFRTVRRFGPNKSYEFTTDYAAPLTGVKRVVVSSADGTTATAVVDGRATRSFVPAPGVVVRFPDGKRAPEVKVPTFLQRAASKLFVRAPSAAATCVQDEMNSPPPSKLESVKALALSGGDLGHPPGSDTRLDPACLLLIAGEYYAYYQCLSASSLGLLCGPFAWACVPGIVVACSLALVVALDVANDSKFCCPAVCGGSNFLPTCCEDGEKCLSEQRSLCCDDSKVPCHGTQCCNQGDACLANGTCCPSDRDACGSVCCDALEVCTDPATGTCCPRPCGNRCCTILQACDFSTNSCITLPDTCTTQVCAQKEDCLASGETRMICKDNCCVVDPL